MLRPATRPARRSWLASVGARVGADQFVRRLVDVDVDDGLTGLDVRADGLQLRTSGLAQDLPGARLGQQTLAAEQHHQHQDDRSEEHTSELQSHHDLVCRLLLEKKKKKKK